MSEKWDEVSPLLLRDGFVRLVERHFGLRLSAHQIQRLADAVATLGLAQDLGGADQFCRELGHGRRSHLFDTLAESVVVPETHFFRIPPQIQSLRETVLPDLCHEHEADRQLCIWSAGCASGEEPYTLAILLRQMIPAIDNWRIRLVASDVSLVALKAARQATYSQWSFRDTPPEIRERYFEPVGKRWRLVDSVRSMVQFVHSNLAADTVPGWQVNDPGFDLIVCRNVTIYFQPKVAQQLYRRFVRVLRPAGWLILGPSDPTPEGGIGLAPVYRPGALVWRRPGPLVNQTPFEYHRTAGGAGSRSQPSTIHNEE